MHEDLVIGGVTLGPAIRNVTSIKTILNFARLQTAIDPRAAIRQWATIDATRSSLDPANNRIRGDETITCIRSARYQNLEIGDRECPAPVGDIASWESHPEFSYVKIVSLGLSSTADK